MLRVLLTNDDGIAARGIRSLAVQLSRRCEVLVVAPDKPRSGTSHSLTLHKPLRLKPVPTFAQENGSKADIEAYSCSGTPTDCVMLGLLHQFADRKVDLVISGVNNGCNVAQDLTYSGTVGGAMEGAIIGVPSIAVSLDLDHKRDFEMAAVVTEIVMARLLFGCVPPWLDDAADKLLKGADDKCSGCWRWPGDAVAITGDKYPAVGDWAVKCNNGTPFVNVNIPDLPIEEIAGIRWTRAGWREYTDIVTTGTDPRDRPYYWIGGERIEHEDGHPGTDTHALAKGYVSVTPISYDITSKPDLERLLNE